MCSVNKARSMKCGIAHNAMRPIAGITEGDRADGITHKTAGKSANQRDQEVIHLAFVNISANPEKPKTSGGTLGCLENRKSTVNEALKILAFWEIDI